MSPNFVILGMGYVAPRHIKAIKDCGGNLLAVYDPHNVGGLLDSYFPAAEFFTDFESLFGFCMKRMGTEEAIDYVSVCSPNFLHWRHSAFGLHIGADVICEKPLALYTKNILYLQELEAKTGKRVHPILQLRYNPELIAAKEYAETARNVKLTYFASRGSWLRASWKADEAKSGGLCTNLAVHGFDALSYLFGGHDELNVIKKTPEYVSGVLRFGKVHVEFEVSSEMGRQSFRNIQIDYREPINLTAGMTDAHTLVYRKILSGEGLKLSDTMEAIRIVEAIRGAHACRKCA